MALFRDHGLRLFSHEDREFARSSLILGNRRSSESNMLSARSTNPRMSRVLRGHRMKTDKTLYVASRRAWRSWLSKHHWNRRGVWLVFYKKPGRKSTIDYEESVEEAVCYGWIDGQIKRIDEEKYARRFTPRRPGSIWSESNKRRALKMLHEGKMTQAGRATLPPAILVNG